MVVVSYSGKEINAKLVYYGAGLSGKTTNLESIYEAVPDTSRGKMVSMKTQSDRTLFFDLLPLDLGEIMGFKTRFLLYTVPGQVFYNATRKLVLKGADAIVFVADSEVGKMEENKDSLANLRANLQEYGLSLDQTPWVIQYNKRDLPNVYTTDELNAELNPGGKVPFFEAVAKDGKGVFETFRGISHLLMEKVTKELRRSPMGSTANSSASTKPLNPDSGGRPAGMHTPPAPPAHATPREPQPMREPSPIREPQPMREPPMPVSALGSANVDYGRELELTDSMTPLGKPAAPPRPAQPQEPVLAAAPQRPIPVAEPERTAARPVHAPVTTVLDASAMPAPPVRAAAYTAAEHAAPHHRPAAPPAPSSTEELVVPVSLPAQGTHEIVLRIVLKIER